MFSLPEGAGALNLRKERFELARLMQEIAAVNGKAIELRVLQYGATRRRLEDALLEQPGWDVVHLSGHGLPAGLMLETDTGGRDLISSTDLVDLLDLAADQLKLVTLSACESAAVIATEHLRQLGLAPATRDTQDGERTGPPASSATSDSTSDSDREGGVGGSLPAVAAVLVERLDCAVLAMRYPVADDFAIALADGFYNLVLGKGQPITKALALTVPRITRGVGVSALSMGTPALFGARATDLMLEPPAGGPVQVEDDSAKLALFPPQPHRFVGRVAAMTRATTALAPRSGRTGVVFHGMAGGGKTACALELAYTHRDVFRWLAWYQAPPDGHDIATALSDFAFALEQQLPGLKLLHQIGDTTMLRAALPGLTAMMRQYRTLIVIDNVESLLTGQGGWRDERWGWVVDALTDHQGLSRLVLTTRHRPERLADSMLVASVHALSLREAVLLARDWPHLGALIDADPPPAGLSVEESRVLAARTLAVVQGHPKLIELADGQAAAPDRLAARLEEADRTWLSTGTRLDAFLDRGESAATDLDYLRVLQGWTRATATTLPDDAVTLFGLLCCVEEDDRVRPVVQMVWPQLWEQLQRPGKPPDLDTALAPLQAAALVAADHDPGTGQASAFRLHPGVADTGRSSAGDRFTTVVDSLLGDLWLTQLDLGREGERERDTGWLVLRAARSAAPYLARRHRWADLDTAAHQLLARDSSAAPAALLLPMLATATEANRDTDLELNLGRTHARALARLDPDQAEPVLRRLLDTALAREQFGAAAAPANDLIILYRERGHFEQALGLVEQMADYTRRAGFGPWTQLLVQHKRLQILYLQGHYQQVLDEVLQARQQWVSLPDPPDPTDNAVTPWNVREILLNVGMLAARGLGRWQQALDLNAEVLESMRRRGASDPELVYAAFNDYGSLLNLDRPLEARELLIRCRAVDEATNNIPSLGKTMSALADVENTLGHRERAIALETDALRYKYLTGDPDSISASHHNLADHLRLDGRDPEQVWAHLLAAAVIRYLTGGGELTLTINNLAALQGSHPDDAPAAIEQVIGLVEDLDGVHLGELLHRLPARTTPQTALDDILHRTTQTPAHARTQRLITMWDPVLAALHTAHHHPDPDTRHTAAAALDDTLTGFDTNTDWRQLVGVLRRLHTGQHDLDTDPAALLAGLDDIDTAITRRALQLLTHPDTAPADLDINPDTWHTLTDPATTTGPDTDSDGEGEGEEGVTTFLDAAVAAADGDVAARQLLDPVLAEMAADPDAAGFAAAVRALITHMPIPDSSAVGSEYVPVLDALRERLAASGTGQETS